MAHEDAQHHDRPKVLIVEDDPAMIAGLRDGFELEGYQVTLAEDGLAGLREAEALSPIKRPG